MPRGRKASMLQDELDDMNLIQGIETAMRGNALAVSKAAIFSGALPIVFVIAVGEMTGPLLELMAQFDRAINDAKLLESSRATTNGESVSGAS
jgi:hypothetical protein